MIYTTVTQECIPVDTEDGMRYQITTTIVDPGELPDVFLFVQDITDVADPKQDVFVRVGSPYDLENVLVGRDSAIAAGVLRYRTNMFVVRYTDLEVAVQAKQAISQRVDTAINTWYTYTTEFESPYPLPVIDHPITDEEYLQTLTNAYKAAVTAREAAEAAAVLAQAQVTIALADAAAAAAMIQIYQNETTFCQTARSSYWMGSPGILSGVSALSSASQAFYSSINALYISDPITYAALLAPLNLMSGQMAAWLATEPYMSMMDVVLATFCSGASTGYSIAVTNKVTKDIAVANAQTAKEQADASVATAQANEDAALAAVKAVCPTFDPSSV
jgi:hypothetical protein